MFAPFKKYKKAIGLFVVILLLLTMIGWTSDSRKEITFVEEVIIGLTSPFQSAVSSVGGRFGAVYTFITDIQGLNKENKELKKQLTRYEGLKIEVDELKNENQRLREMLDFKEREEYELEPAKVIGRSQDTWNSTILLNRGKNHGIEKNMPVVTDEGLVGKTISVSSNASKVLLLVDPDSAVSSLVQQTRVMGIVEGKGARSTQLQMVNVPKDADISEGSKVLSSGLGPVFPKGLVIGEIEVIEEEMTGFTDKAVIDPAVNFDRLEEVFIVLDGKKSLDIDKYEEKLDNLEPTEEENDVESSNQEDGIADD
ncbi:rod shape-determining protein MreC [Natranaerobius trueperi]|uniref:Cell shape-determining protein MreC n=1 Tax=Natranaerobius trueperi TaxID=759412 RepID=A0A226BY10_9FIRM|nr:rod shape-determining protein MreC [Natranaerobius trueperi]OWZ83918.1 rod shape-determining protein MreC [Natranaerobius trueperi]